MIYENSATYLYVANEARNGATTLEDLPVGAVALQLADGTFNAASNVLVDETVRVVQKLPGGQIAASPYFNSLTANRTATAYSESVEQVTYLGASAVGTVTGLAAPAVGDSVILNVTLLHSQGIYNNTPLIKTIPYRAELATSLDLVRGLKSSFIHSFKREPDQTIRCERISDGAVATQSDDAIIGYLQYGSTTIQYLDEDLAADDGTQLAGDVLALPSANGREFEVTVTDQNHLVLIGTHRIDVTTGGGTTTTRATAIAAAINDSAVGDRVTASSAVAVVTITYGPDFFALPPVLVDLDTDEPHEVTIEEGENLRVRYIMPEAITNENEGELDMPWQGPTGYVAFHATPADRPASAGQTATGDVNEWGLKFSGLKQPFNPVTGRYKKTRFHVASSDILEQPVDVQGAALGNGTWEQVSELEVYSKFNEDGGLGVTEKYPPTKYRGQVPEGAQYNVIVINAFDNNMRPVTSGVQYGSRWNIVLAINALEAAESTALHTELGV